MDHLAHDVIIAKKSPAYGDSGRAGFTSIFLPVPFLGKPHRPNKTYHDPEKRAKVCNQVEKKRGGDDLHHHQQGQDDPQKEHPEGDDHHHFGTNVRDHLFIQPAGNLVFRVDLKIGRHFQFA
jgi:hypothetical protein